MNLSWIQCERGVYCTLLRVDLTNQDGDGVYLIWHKTSGQAIYVGQGNIRERLEAHRVSDLVHLYGYEALLATWVFVPGEEDRKAIERYLHRVLSPIASTCNEGIEIQVNLPA